MAEQEWSPPPASCCPELDRGQALLKAKRFDEAVVEFHAAALAADTAVDQIQENITCIEGGVWTNEEIVLSVRLYLLKALCAANRMGEAFHEARSIQRTMEAKETVINCRRSLVLLTCQRIVELAREATDEKSIGNNRDDFIMMGLAVCRILLASPTTGGNRKQRKKVYIVESELYEKMGKLDAAAASTEALIAEMPVNSDVRQHKSRLYDLHLRLGLIDVEAERAEEARKKKKNEHTKRLRRNRLDEVSARLEGKLEELAEQIEDRVDRPLNESAPSFFQGLNISKDEREISRTIDWGSIPPTLTPNSASGGGIKNNKDTRVRRKRLQLEALYVLLCDLIDRHQEASGRGELHVVDFGSGSGNSCLVFAWLLRGTSCRFTFLDFNPQAVAIGKQRASDGGLESTVSWVCGDVSEFIDSFDIGMATHLCGGATDIAMDKCFRNKAAFLVTPCCLGKIKFHVDTGTNGRDNNSLQYPRSIWLRGHLSAEEYVEMSRFGDCTDTTDTERGREKTMRLEGKKLLDADRLEVAREAGYETELGKLGSKSNCGPKSDVLCGMCNAL
jgi:SAM-dependent methyltransferase